MSAINILIFLHGVVIDAKPGDHLKTYLNFFKALTDKQPRLKNEIGKQIFVEWGHALSANNDNLTPDQELTGAENTLIQDTSYNIIRNDPQPNEFNLGLVADLPLRASLRMTLQNLKEKVINLGIGDAFYYTSPDGERNVRNRVYTEVLTQLEEYKGIDKVALHLIGHSQGVTIGHDFLFGLFAPPSQWGTGAPDFSSDKSYDEGVRKEYLFWREAAQNKQLVLGSKSSFGCQLAIMMLRKQKLVTKLRLGEKIDPSVIGVLPSNTPKWKIFYDTNDPIGFPAKRVFLSNGEILEYEVDSNFWPPDAHGGYWINEQVQSEIAELIVQNLI